MVLTYDRALLSYGDRFAGGNESNLYDLSAGFCVAGQRGPFVFKEYFRTVIEAGSGPLNHQLDTIVRGYKEIDPDARRVIDKYAAWPLGIVTHEGDAIGVVMRKLNSQFVEDATGSVKIAVLEQWLWPPSKVDRKMRELGLPPLNPDRRKDLTLKILAYYSEVHRLGWVVGDISFGNVMLFLPPGKSTARPLFFEIDTYRRLDGQLNTQQRDTPSWVAPETKVARAALQQGKARGLSLQRLSALQAAVNLKTQASDVWKVGLLIARLYDCSEAPTQAGWNQANLASVRTTFGVEAAEALERAGSKNPATRPSMYDLMKAFVDGR